MKNIETKYRVQFQTQENMIQLLRQQLVNIEEKYEAARENLQEAHERVVSELQEKIAQLQVEREQDGERFKELQLQQEQYVQQKIADMIRESDALLQKIKEGYDESLQEMQQKIDKKTVLVAEKEKYIRILSEKMAQQDADQGKLQRVIDAQQEELAVLGKRVSEITRHLDIL